MVLCWTPCFSFFPTLLPCSGGGFPWAAVLQNKPVTVWVVHGLQTDIKTCLRHLEYLFLLWPWCSLCCFSLLFFFFPPPSLPVKNCFSKDTMSSASTLHWVHWSLGELAVSGRRQLRPLFTEATSAAPHAYAANTLPQASSTPSLVLCICCAGVVIYTSLLSSPSAWSLSISPLVVQTKGEGFLWVVSVCNS